MTCKTSALPAKKRSNDGENKDNKNNKGSRSSSFSPFRIASNSINNLGRQDKVLFVTIAISMTVGILLPSFGLVFTPYLLVWLGFLLFLNLIRLNLQELTLTFARPQKLAVLSAMKLLVIPLTVYSISKVVYEPIAVPALLLSGISTGLGAPFVINTVEKSNKLPLVVGMVVVTSLAVPFTLPPLVYLLLGDSEFEIPILHMVFLLAAALFTPIAAGWLTKKKLPTVANRLDEKSFPASIVLVALINLGVFAEISDLFFRDQNIVLINIVAAFTLFTVFGATGYFSGGVRLRLGSLAKINNKRISGNSSKGSSSNRTQTNAPDSSKKYNSTGQEQKDLKIVGLITMSYVNNVLVFVFASQFFGIDVAALAAFYNLPYYGLIVVLKMIIKG